MSDAKSFTEQLDAKSLERFNEISKAQFSEQAQFFLNAFWEEVGSEAEFIYEVAFDILKMADMRWKNVSYVHLYEEGDDIDFDTSIYLFEQLVKFCEDPKNAQYRIDYPKSMPVMMTSIVRKKELRDKVDINFDGRVSFLEYLLYQYQVSPKDLMDRSKPVSNAPVNQALINAKKALDEVNKKIKEYEAKRQKLLADSELGGVKGLRAKNELAQLDSSPLAETLRKLLISAEAAVRIAARQGGSVVGEDGEQVAAPPTEGVIWWMQKDIAVKKAKYGRKAK